MTYRAIPVSRLSVAFHFRSSHIQLSVRFLPSGHPCKAELEGSGDILDPRLGSHQTYISNSDLEDKETCLETSLPIHTHIRIIENPLLGTHILVPSVDHSHLFRNFCLTVVCITVPALVVCLPFIRLPLIDLRWEMFPQLH